MRLINTDRLHIIELTEADADFIFELVNDSDWIKNIGDRGIKNTNDAKRYILDVLVPAYEENGYGFHLVRHRADQKPLGICGIIKRPFLEYADIGFAFLPDSRGKGFALEATQAIFKYAQEYLKVEHIAAVTIPSNKPSIRLLEKIGFSFDKMIEWPEDGTQLMYYISGT